MPHALIIFITKHGYLAIFSLVFLQEIGIPNPVTNEAVLLFSGYLTSIQVLSFPLVFLTAVLADCIGTTLLYGVFYFFGHIILTRHASWLPIKKEKIEQFSERISRSGQWEIFVGRLIPFVRGYTSIAAGLLQIKPKIYIPAIIFPAILWSGGYVLAGKLLGSYWSVILEKIKSAEEFILIGVLIIIGFFIIRWYKRRSLKRWPLPKVSILIPAYNEEKLIGQAVKSALAQDYPNFEVIVIDNASTDRTADIVQSIADPRLRLVTEIRQGTQFARECGRKVATGDIIANLDADGIPEKNWLSRGVRYFKNPRVVAASGPYAYYDAPFFFRLGTFFGQYILILPTNMLAQLFRCGAVLIGGNMFIRASVLELAGGYDTNITFYGDDADTARRVAQYGRVKYIPNLIVETSARRFAAVGFSIVQKKYIKSFLSVIFHKKMSVEDSKEEHHPR